MEPRIMVAAVVLAAAALTGCTPGADAGGDGAPAPGPSEVFRWGGQPLEVAAAPDGWRRERTQSGGIEGMRFVKTGSVGEEIAIGEYYSLDRRDRCGEIAEILAEFDSIDWRGLADAVRTARLHAVPPINDDEETLAAAVNDRLDRAVELLRLEEDRAGARRAVEDALQYAGRVAYTTQGVAAPARFSLGPAPGLRFKIDDSVPASVGGTPAERIEYELEYGGRTYRGRQLLVEHNNRLFVLRFQGLAENLPLFDRIVESVSFPPGDCTHP